MKRVRQPCHLLSTNYVGKYNGCDFQSQPNVSNENSLRFQPDIQNRLRAEIKEALLKSNGDLSYEDIQSMKYLQMVVQGK